jgi:glycosyltransferase involved in cell wall biosynthesis
MHIGINAHLLAFTSTYRQAGLSRYIYEMLLKLPPTLPAHHFTAFVGNSSLPPYFLSTAPSNLAFSHSRLPTLKAPVRIAWEQTALPLSAARTHLDLLFSPVNIRPLVSPCPTVITIHDVIFLHYPRSFHPLKRLYLTLLTGWSARHSTHVITVSEATRRDVIRLLHLPPRRVTTVHNGVGSQFKPYPQQERDAFRRSHDIEGRVILYLGTLEPRKNITTLIEAFAAIASLPDLHDVTLLIGGSKGWYYDEIFATAERVGLTTSNRVRFLGRVPDDELPLWYNIAALCAYPSLYEGFGLPPLEAMACGTPVAVSDRSALPEVVGEAGILVDPEDVPAWSAAILRLLQHPDLAADLARRGPVQAAKFSWERSALETAEVLRRAAPTKREGKSKQS